MRKSLLGAAAVAALMLPGSALAQGGTIKIGILVALEGAFATGGADGVRNVELALKQVNNTIAGKKVETVVAPTDTKPDTTVRMARKLVEQDKVDLIIGNDAMEEVEGLDRHELMREPFLLLVPASMPSAGGEAGLAKLARNYPMICYHPHSFLGAQIARQLANRNVRATRRVSVDTSDSLIAMVAAGVGWTSTTPLCLLVGRPYLPRVKILPFPGPRFSRRLVLVSRSGEHSALASRLARIAGQILATDVRAELKTLSPGLADRIAVSARAGAERERP